MDTKVKEEAAKVVNAPLREAAPIVTRQANIEEIVGVTDMFFDSVATTRDQVQNRIALQQEMIRGCISLTTPTQWTKFVDEKSGKATLYPQGAVADSILRRMFGCTWDEKEATVEVDAEGNPRLAKASAVLCSSRGRHIERFYGSREAEGFLKTREDLIKGAFENMKSCAVRDVLGLRGRSPEDYKALGLDIDKVPSAKFQNSKDSDIDTFPPFGKFPGRKISDPEITLGDLEWYAKRSEENLKNPAKQKWHKSEEKRLAAYRVEWNRRKGVQKTTTPHDPTTGEIKDPPPPTGDLRNEPPAENGWPREPGQEG